MRYSVQTHLHIDHAGKDDHFSMTTTVVVKRRELECAVSGLMPPEDPKPDIIHLIERLHTPQALRLEDLEPSGLIGLILGLVLEAAHAHTEGSLNVHVETAGGRAKIYSYVIDDSQEPVVVPFRISFAEEVQVTGNHAGSKRAEKAAIGKLRTGSALLRPVHDKPAKVHRGRVVGRLAWEVPGPVSHSVHRPAWCPA